jgi:hypothetical protein
MRRAPLTEEDWMIWIRLGASSLANDLYDVSISGDRVDAWIMRFCKTCGLRLVQGRDECLVFRFLEPEFTVTGEVLWR